MADPLRVQLLKQIGSADDVNLLRVLRLQAQEHMETILPTSPVEQFNLHLNEVHDAVIRRAIALAEAEMARLGMGSPPVPYAYLLFGSGGRIEQTLSSDQDSGLVYEDPAAGQEAVRSYYLKLAGIIVDILKRVGYPPCEGNVLSDNPEWCMSLNDWKLKLNGWFEEPTWEAVRYLLIIADGRCVHGESALAHEIKRHYFNDTLNNPIIVKRMLDNTMRHKVLLNIFGQLLKEQYGENAGSLDIKYGAYIPMVNAVRMMAIQAGVHETSTFARLKKLVESGKLEPEEAEKYEQAFRLFIRLRLMTISVDKNGWFANNGKLASAKLSKEMTDELKSGLRIGKRLQRKVYKQTMGRFK